MCSHFLRSTGFSMGEGTRERISYKSVSGPCISIKNPKIYLPVEVTGDPAYNTNMQFLDLPDISKFERIHGTRAELNSLRFLGASHRLMESNWGAPQCSAFRSPATPRIAQTCSFSTCQTFPSLSEFMALEPNSIHCGSLEHRTD